VGFVSAYLHIEGVQEFLTKRIETLLKQFGQAELPMQSF
jgi:hypothetical protein